MGKSSRTNVHGITSLIKAFPSYMVHMIDIQKLQDSNSQKALHLKSFCSMGNEHTILVGGEIGERFRKWITNRPTGECHPYKFLSLPDMEAANAVYVNGTLIRRASSEFPNSSEAFAKLDVKQVEVEASELAKVDGALTCCSVLF